MDAIREQAQQLAGSWDNVFQKAAATPDVWKPHLPNLSLEIVDEVTKSFVGLVDRARAPTGFGPGFALAKSVAASALVTLNSHVKQLEAGQYNYLPSFVGALMSGLSAAHTMMVFSPRDDLEQIAADVGVKTAEALALVNTAQQELGKKVEKLEQADEWFSTAEQAATEAPKYKKALSDLVTELTTLRDNTKQEFSESIDALVEEVTSFRDGAKEAHAEAGEASKQAVAKRDELTAQLGFEAEATARLRKLIEGAEEIQRKELEQQAKIDEVLPKGASAGLAAAFTERGDNLDKPLKIWIGVFVGSVLGLAAMSAYIVWALHGIADGAPLSRYWEYLLLRVPFVAPFIWLGWFSAVQYGNIIRVQEDYAFKKATSIAFQGYRDHMEHLHDVDAGEAGTAMKLLATSTIEILSREPLRIYKGPHTDASPTAHSIGLVGRLAKWARGLGKQDEPVGGT